MSRWRKETFFIFCILIFSSFFSADTEYYRSTHVLTSQFQLLERAALVKTMHTDLATNNSYHFFGDLWLENPEEHLRAEELERLKILEPLIRQLEFRREDGNPPSCFQELTA